MLCAVSATPAGRAHNLCKKRSLRTQGTDSELRLMARRRLCRRQRRQTLSGDDESFEWHCAFLLEDVIHCKQLLHCLEVCVPEFIALTNSCDFGLDDELQLLVRTLERIMLLANRKHAPCLLALDDLCKRKL